MWYLFLFACFTAFNLLAYIVLMGRYLYIKLIHHYLRKRKNIRKTIGPVSLSLCHTSEKDNLYESCFGKMEEFEICECEDLYSSLSPIGHVTALFSKSETKKWLECPGKLTYYEHNGKKFFVSFRPYHKQDKNLHTPHLPLTTVGFVCFAISWSIVVCLLGYSIMLLAYTV